MAAEDRARRLHSRVVLERAPNVAWRDCDDEVVVLDLCTRRALGLDALGARVWGLLDGSRDLGAIVEHLAEGADRPATELGEFIERLMEGLLARGCVVLPGEATASERPVGPPGVAPPAEALLPEPELIPGIAWQETLEESGVFAGCAKDDGGEIGGQCLTNPSSLAS